MLKKTMSDESGRALALALIILGIGMLLIPTFLSHVSTNLLTSRPTEEGMKDLYAADAGVDHALWKLTAKPDYTGTYTITINDRTVWITITNTTEGE